MPIRGPTRTRPLAARVFRASRTVVREAESSSPIACSTGSAAPAGNRAVTIQPAMVSTMLSWKAPKLASEVRDLKEGLEMVEEKARSELGMVKPNEILVQIAK